MSAPGRSGGDGDRVALVREYIRRIDRNDFPAEFFAEGFQFYVPKFGIGHGVAEFMEMARGFTAAYHGVSHVIDLVADCGSVVLLEGRTSGTGADGAGWRGGETPGGRFCSVFEIDASGRIARMHIYLDPDYTSQDRDRFRWDRGAAQRW